MLQLSVTYSSISFRRYQENPSSRREGTSIQRREEKSTLARRGKRERALFICFSLPGPVLCKLGQPGVLFVLPEVLTLVLGPSFVLFVRAFPFLSFSHRHFGLLFLFGLQGEPTNPSQRRSFLGVLGRTDAKAETLILWPPYVKS